MTALSFRVHGLPAAQGSKRHVGMGRMIESSKFVAPWRQAVKYAAMKAKHVDGTEYPSGGVTVDITFIFPRPKAHYYTGKRQTQLRDGAPDMVWKKPDIDKLLRSTFDALTEAGVWRDDAQAVTVNMQKVYAGNDEIPGAQITLIGDAG